MPHRLTARLARWQIWLLTLSGSALWLSGSAWLLLHYYGQATSEFGPVMNPLEPWMMKAHGLALIPALLGIGGMFVAHVPKGWKHQAQRIAGIVLCTFLGLLVASGYLLYYLGDEGARELTSLVHWSVGFVLPVSFVWHWLNGLKQRERRHPRANASGKPK